jgi:hypothetical protein
VARRDRPVRVLTNSPYAAIVAAALPGLDIVAFEPGAPAEQARADARQAIARYPHSSLIVDTFPRGLGGELTVLLGQSDARTVLVHRDLNPRYVESLQLRPFVEALYDLVLIPGAGEGSQFADLPMAVATPPWLVRSAAGLPEREHARTVLALRPHEPHCVLICVSGKPAEREWYRAVAAELRTLAPDLPVRSVAAVHDVRYWPAMDLFGCAAVVVGGAGYNTVEECLAWGVPLVARAWPRTYDRQERRARSAAARGCVVLVQSPAEAAIAALEHMLPAPPRLPRFVNGAEEAACSIAATLGNSTR